MSPTLLDLENKSEAPIKLSPEEQRELAQRAKNCDQEAWGRLYGSYRKSILGFFRGRIYDKSIAEDLCQDTFLLAYKNLRECKYDPTYSFSKYLQNIRSIILMRYYSNGETIKVGEGESENCGEKKKEKKGEGIQVKYRDPNEVQPPEPNADGSESYEDVLDRISHHRSWEETPPQVKALIRLEVLRLTTICCAKPHQVISFDFIKLLEWRPKEVVKELSDKKLRDLAENFVNDYLDTFKGFFNRERLCEYYSDLCLKLERLVKEVYLEPEYEERIIKYFASTRVENLILKEFYGTNPEASLADWCYKVKERTRILLNEGIICGGRA